MTEEMREFASELLNGVSVMMSEQENRIVTNLMTYIENGVAKDVRVLAEKVQSLDTRVGALEEAVANLQEDMTVVKLTVTHQNKEIYELKRISG